MEDTYEQLPRWREGLEQAHLQDAASFLLEARGCARTAFHHIGTWPKQLEVTKMNRSRPVREFLGRAPFVLIGVVSITAIVGNFVTLLDNIALTAEVWRSVTRPIWGFLVGWLFDLFEVELQWWLKDYLSMGVVTSAMIFRSEAAYKNIAVKVGSFDPDDDIQMWVQKTYDHWRDWLVQLITLVMPIFLWPLVWYWRIRRSAVGSSLHYFEELPSIVKHANKERQAVFWETVIWTLILLVANYVLIEVFAFSGREPDQGLWV